LHEERSPSSGNAARFLFFSPAKHLVAGRFVWQRLLSIEAGLEFDFEEFCFHPANIRFGGEVPPPEDKFGSKKKMDSFTKFPKV